MERPKNYIIIILFIFFYNNASATFKENIYRAFISNNMELWKNTILDMTNLKGKNNDQILELINYQYGYIAWCIGNNKMDEAKMHLSSGEKNIEFLWKQDYNLSMLNAYKSAFYGYKISFNKMQAPFYGSRSLKCANESIKIDKNNPLPYIQLGNSEFYMPPVFGGSKSKALEYFKKAEKLLEQNPEKIKNDWNYLSLLVMIYNCQKELKKYIEAKECLQKALKVEPGYLWVKNELYPEIEKLLKSRK